MLLLLAGCPQRPQCPNTCDDGNECTADSCGRGTGYECSHAPLNGDIGTCSGEVDECNTKTCVSGVCTTATKQVCSYEVQCDDFDIVSPSYEFFESVNHMPSFSCRIDNNGGQQGTITLSSEIDGYSNEFEKMVTIGAGETEYVDVFFTYKDEFYDLTDTKSAILKTKVSAGATDIYVDSKTVQIEKSSVYSPELGDDALVAMWVTYNDPCIEEIISEAKKFAPGGQFIGYMGDMNSINEELAAVFYALYYQDIKYVSSTFASTNIQSALYNQDIRFPYRSLKYKQMNCIDGAVLYAAILEKLDYQTGIGFVPGHAFVMVRNIDGNWLPIETTVTGDDVTTFEQATEIGKEQMLSANLQVIDIHAAIEAGVTPMPVGEHDCEIKDLSEIAEAYQGLLSGDCYDADYGQMENGYCSYDHAAYCLDGVVYWDMDGSECGGVYPNCMDADYGYIDNGYCSSDNAVYCWDGAVYWAEPGDCSYSMEASEISVRT